MTILDAVAEHVHPSDLALTIYSSGTTDRPKGVLHNHQAVALQFWTQARLVRARRVDTACGARCPCSGPQASTPAWAPRSRPGARG